jgi:pimeloyl-ACP methyl ester carboxylesterase
MPDKKKKSTSRSPSKRRSKQSAGGPVPGEQTAFALSPDLLERSLVTGEGRGLLEDYFGPENYEQLRDLARDAAKRSVRGGPRVLILPGIMGSTLGRTRLLHTEDILWIDPIEVALGKLTALKLDGGSSPYHAVGTILFAYLKLKLRLKIAGFDADFFPYDWRRSLADAGEALADAIQQEKSDVMLAAHSMGGLVARAALARSGKKVTRLVMMGTPNYGSFAPVQVIRGTYDVVLKVARLDLRHTADELSDQVFNTFPGLYEMLPAPEKFSAIDLYHEANWPQAGPQPKEDLLLSVKTVIDKLAPADSRFFLIAGVNQDTVVGLRVDGNEFSYEVSPDGDGTVPLDFARLVHIPENQIYYVEESHGSLPNNGAVESAVIDLLSKGSTAALPPQRPQAKRGTRFVPESALREMAQRSPGSGQLGSADYRHLLDAVAAPPRSTDIGIGAVAGGAGVIFAGTGSVGLDPFQHLTIGRRRQRRIEINLAHGSLTDVNAPAYVLGNFRNVAPSGAARAIDQRLDGAITEFTARRMLNGEIGSVFIVPVGRNLLPADMVLFAGLGSFDRFNADVQQLVAENVIRVLVRTRIDEFATILIGAGSGQSPSSVLNNLLIGFLRGLKDADLQHRFRGITVCETDSARFSEMRSELYRLAGTSLFDDVELTLDQIEVPPPETPLARALKQGQEPVYAIVREEGESSGRLHNRVSILGSGMKAAVVSSACDIDKSRLAGLLDRFDKAVGPGSKVQDVQSFGREFADLILPAEVCTVLQSMKDRHIVVVHDAPNARVPWETLTIENWTAAVEGGLSRRYLADHLPVATWLEQRRVAPSLRLLLVANPLGDLDGAEEEADRIAKLAGTSIEVTPLRQKAASKAAILAALRTGKFDCIHYAGHAFFDPQGPSRSGLVCAGQQILTGADLVGISNLPCFIFFNACEAGRVRGRPGRSPKPASQQVTESYGVAEALMRGGIANYMSTYWPVGDQAAETFATTFYKDVLEGNAIGAAMLAGRQAVLKLGARDWADYILYGSFDFVLKQPKPMGQ